MIAFFANAFGYVLNFLYEHIGNYGLAIILFSVLIKILMLPISIKQQKTMKKSQAINDEMKQIQFKYKNDPEKMNQEVMALYKREKMSPFSGCLSAIVQILLLFSVFFLVRSPLTYMKKIDKNDIDKLQSVVEEHGDTSNYKEIAIIKYVNALKSIEKINKEELNDEQLEQVEKIEEEKNKLDINLDDVYVNMNFLGLNLSKVPTEDLSDLKVLIIPALYVVSSFISIRLANKKQKINQKNKLLDDGENKEKVENEVDPMQNANRTMNWMMPIMSVSIACIAPLGLALYWLVNNILIILEKIIIDKYIIKDDKKEEAQENA